jgi:hypothetical protein
VTEPSARPSHEFTPEQNTTIEGLAAAMSFVGVFQLIAGLLIGVAAVLSFLGGNLISAIWYVFLTVANILLGVTLFGAADSFRQIVATTGADVEHLMGALQSLARYFSIRRTMILVTLFVIALGIIAGLLLFEGSSR